VSTGWLFSTGRHLQQVTFSRRFFANQLAYVRQVTFSNWPASPNDFRIQEVICQPVGRSRGLFFQVVISGWFSYPVGYYFQLAISNRFSYPGGYFSNRPPFPCGFRIQHVLCQPVGRSSRLLFPFGWHFHSPNISQENIKGRKQLPFFSDPLTERRKMREAFFSFCGNKEALELFFSLVGLSSKIV